jgi:hypothetical protein
VIEAGDRTAASIMVAHSVSRLLTFAPRGGSRTRALRRGLIASAIFLMGAVPAGGASTITGTASALVGGEVTVACDDLAQYGWWGAAEVGVPHIQLDHDVCAVLASAPRLRPGHLLRPSSGASVLTLAHEAAHVRGVEDEREADCFGMANLHRTALALGYRATQLPRLDAQALAVSECS